MKRALVLAPALIVLLATGVTVRVLSVYGSRQRGRRGDDPPS